MKCEYEKSESEKRAVAALRTAERKRQLDRASTLNLYTFRFDGGSYGVPFVCVNDDVAAVSMRNVIDQSGEPEAYAKCDLYCIGTYNVRTAKVSSCKPRFVSF